MNSKLISLGAYLFILAACLLPMMAKARLFGMDSTDQRQLNDDEYTDQDYSQNLDQTSTEDLEQAEYETPPENQRSIGLDGWLSYWARENIIKQLIDKRNEPAPPYPDRSPKSRRKEHANTTQSPSPNLDENSTLATPSEEPTQPTITTTPSEEPTQPTITTTPSEEPTQPTITTTPSEGPTQPTITTTPREWWPLMLGVVVFVSYSILCYHWKNIMQTVRNGWAPMISSIRKQFRSKICKLRAMIFGDCNLDDQIGETQKSPA